MQLNYQELVPPLKWAGGKRWFASKYRELLPERFNRYLEPFVGSAALFFALKPENAVLSDINSDLINFYSILRANPTGLRKKLAEHQRLHCKDYYYKMRAACPRSEVGRAARFLYLNRTCWNGLYRVNLKGQFNVPVGTKSAVLLDTDNFEEIATSLNKASIICADFESTIDMAEHGDFVFVDPPYTVAHNFNGFVKYNEVLFSWQDQQRLKAAVARAVHRGASVLITNAAHESVIKLYADFKQLAVSRAGVIAGKSSARGKFDELIIRSY